MYAASSLPEDIQCITLLAEPTAPIQKLGEKTTNSTERIRINGLLDNIFSLQMFYNMKLCICFFNKALLLMTPNFKIK